jgi:hypothetical protein
MKVSIDRVIGTGVGVIGVTEDEETTYYDFKTLIDIMEEVYRTSPVNSKVEMAKNIAAFLLRGLAANDCADGLQVTYNGDTDSFVTIKNNYPLTQVSK